MSDFDDDYRLVDRDLELGHKSLIELERGSGTVTTVAEEDVLTAAELDFTVDPITEETAFPAGAEQAAAAAAEAAEQPFFRIVKGAPSDADIAALVCVLAAAANTGSGAVRTGPADTWGRPAMMHRGTTPMSPYAFPQLSHPRE